MSDSDNFLPEFARMELAKNGVEDFLTNVYPQVMKELAEKECIGNIVLKPSKNLLLMVLAMESFIAKEFPCEREKRFGAIKKGRKKYIRSVLKT